MVRTATSLTADGADSSETEVGTAVGVSTDGDDDGETEADAAVGAMPRIWGRGGVGLCG